MELSKVEASVASKVGMRVYLRVVKLDNGMVDSSEALTVLRRADMKENKLAALSAVCWAEMMVDH